MAVEQQMEMAFMEDRPTVDPVSGNEVPPGSLPEEVRDDIDARLSEGEYVVPADVVRYYGVKFFEDLRGQAKMGLAEMEADGRIGGEPVNMAAASQEPIEALSEEDIMRMQESIKAGAAEGGLMDKFALAAKRDPLVNSRMNAKGYRVGFSEGGMVQSLYQDPTRVDSVIDNLMAEARKSPAMMGELAKRGITVNSTAANMQPDEMQKESKEATKAFAEGGDTKKYHSGFDPFQYGLGFSTIGMGGGTGTGASSGSMLGQYMVDYYNPATGETMQIPHDSITNVPLKPIPAGFIRGVPPAEEPETSAQKEDNGDSTPKPEDDEGAGNKWQENYDYTDAKKLFEDSSSRLEEGASLLGTISPLFGKIEQARRHAEVAANAIVLRAAGYTDEADKLTAQLEKYRNSAGLKFMPMSFIDGDQLAKSALENLPIGGLRTATYIVGEETGFDNIQDYAASISQDYGSGFTEQEQASVSAGMTQDAMDDETTVMQQQVKPSSNNNNNDEDAPTHAEIMEAHYGTDWSDTQTEEQEEASNVFEGASPTGGWTPEGFDFGQNRGGLMKKPKK